ncbi:UTP--glucose-1-phosphate uridylyltransferase [Rhodobacter sp. SGA-6-6]|uniref:UTP--glucose-1-phosphate uridylyltransferase n=1 Tax=Rhodobacter sp. SGA-6-6 TaxID=2710882 RepID=UPI0013EB2099|nr:sugar phosphate nucleotidyltransferase [Rhodobacter sp. SGA-6-6]NGM47571.1 UTP--glucose-1-phosphate uridylyltransferase [Rhodobacter sp. SGA-6-6]
MSTRTVIIPAAGHGTRLLPATRMTAKELLPIYDRVAIDFAMEEAAGAGVERIVLVISASKEAIRTYLGPVDATQPRRPSGSGRSPGRPKPEVCFVIQEKALGLGHAVLCCKHMVLPGPFAVLLPDDIIMGPNCLEDMTTHYTTGHMIAAMEVKAHETSQYGIFQCSGPTTDRRIPVSGMVEKPWPGTAPSLFAAVGRYILDPTIFGLLERTPLGKGGELQLTDAIAAATRNTDVSAFRFVGTRYDCGNHDGLLAASVARQSIVRQKTAARDATDALSVVGFGASGVKLSA